jgi:hypothetical protein
MGQLKKMQTDMESKNARLQQEIRSLSKALSVYEADVANLAGQLQSGKTIV